MSGRAIVNFWYVVNVTSLALALGIQTEEKNRACCQNPAEALDCATQEGFLHVGALALIRAGLALRHVDGHKGKPDDFLRRSEDAYREWGSKTTVETLEQRYAI